jgi:hypothetical protein
MMIQTLKLNYGEEKKNTSDKNYIYLLHSVSASPFSWMLEEKEISIVLNVSN